MPRTLSVDDLWNSAPSAEGVFRAADIDHLPEAARRYLEHAIAPGTPLARAVRLRMHGELKVQRWLPFTAEQVIVWDQGFIWAATARMVGLPIRGSDRLVDGQGAMRWKLLGIIPLITASGPDITRSAAGRLAAETTWLPSVLCGHDVSWAAPDPSYLKVTLSAYGETTELNCGVGEAGQLETVQLPRWGNPEGGEFQYVSFGGIMEEERTFGGYSIPTRLRVGWYYGTDRFEPEGEFFRGTIDEATYR